MVKKRLVPFEDSLFVGELNRFSGSGGELLLKGPGNDLASTRIEVGDTLIGIGVTHLVESLSRPPGPDSFRAMDEASLRELKVAARAFRATNKVQGDNGFEFSFAPLSPEEYSATLARVSAGQVKIPPETIPRGTIIMSFLHSDRTYTLQLMDNSPGENWRRATSGERHWNVGVAKDSDFWRATFPSDDIGLLKGLPSYHKVGEIRFGLSLLPGSKFGLQLKPVPYDGPTGRTTYHDFVLSGYATGTAELDTPFPIGLRTDIRFYPIAERRNE